MHIERQTGNAFGLTTGPKSALRIPLGSRDIVSAHGDDVHGVRMACTTATTMGPATVSRMLPIAYGTV